MEAKLLAIKYSINQTIQVSGVSYIIVITDAIHVAYQIFDSFIHPYQHQLITILKDLRGVKIEEGRLNLFPFLFIFFLFDFISLFSIFRTTGVRVDQSRHHIKSPDGKVTRQITRLGRI